MPVNKAARLCRTLIRIGLTPTSFLRRRRRLLVAVRNMLDRKWTRPHGTDFRKLCSDFPVGLLGSGDPAAGLTARHAGENALTGGFGYHRIPRRQPSPVT